MINLSRHLARGELSRLADGELDADSRARAMAHVASCSKCSQSLSFIRQLGEAGRDMKHPRPPKGLLDEILRHRSEGARVILPAVSPPSPRGRRLPAAAAAAVIVAALAGLATLTLTSEAGAGSSELKVIPAQPVPGESVRVEYRPGGLLAGETALRLRLRLRRPETEPPRETLGALAELVLEPDGDGRFVGTYRLPPDFAYATMAVENLAGDRLDDRQGRLWSLRAGGEGGVPTLEALRQEFLVAQRRSWPEADAALHEMTVLYPDRAEGWSLQLVYGSQVQLEAEQAASKASHREILRELDEQARRRAPSVTEIASLARYAQSLGDEEARDYWLSRLESVDPAHNLVLIFRAAGLGSAPAGGDAYLEGLWSVGGHQTSDVCRIAFDTATDARDSAAAHRWALRCLPLVDDQSLRLEMALILVAEPDSRPEGISALRSLLTQLGEGADEERPLHDTRADFRRQSGRLQAKVQLRFGKQWLDSGAPARALLEFDAADGPGLWMPELFRQRLEALLMLGDEAGALTDFHRLDADPVYPRTSVDSLRRRLPSLTREQLAEGTTRAQDEMRERLLQVERENRGLPGIPLLTSTGQTRSLESLQAGMPTVLMFWDRRVFGGLESVAEIVRAGDLLSDGGGQLLWVTPEPHSESLQSFRRLEGLSLPAYQDPASELATALGEWGLRGYFVIDRTGVIRIRSQSLMEAVRHLEVLQRGSRDTA